MALQAPLPLDFSEAVAARSRQLAEGLEPLPGGPAGWRPSRLLFRNFWLFEREEFRFVHGRLFLRGANASGKSTVLAAAVPLVLDGDRTRHRLDPFGGGGRSLQYFLLGPDSADQSDRDAFYHEQRTGYVALEFMRPRDGAPPEYRTVGIGLHCSRHRQGLPVTFWGFCVRDGRRLGQDLDFVGPDGAPLRRQDLEQLLGGGGTVVSTVGAYRDLVNEALFGFADGKDYAHVLSLLLELRAPKLNRDMGPNVVGELLAQSLVPVDRELFEQLRAILERIDDYVDSCDELRRRTEAAGRLDEAVSRMQRLRAETCADRYLEALGRLRQAQAEQRRASSAAGQARGELEAARGNARRVQAQMDEVEGRLRALRESAVLRADEALASAEENLRQVEARVRARGERAQELQRRLERAAKAEAAKRAIWSTRAGRLRTLAEAFAAAAARAEWPLAAAAARDVAEVLRPVWSAPATGQVDPESAVRATWLVEAAAEREERLNLVRRRLQDTERAEGAERAAQTTFALVHEQTVQAREEQVRREAALQTAAEAASDAVREWHEGLRDLEIDPAAAEAACRALEAHRAADADASACLDPLRRAASEHTRRGQERRRRLERARDDAAARAVAKAEELRACEAQTEAVPPRAPGVLAARAVLVGAGIEARPLYEACDVSSQLDPPTAAAVEAAAEQAGLLDALVVAPDVLPHALERLGAAGLGDVFVTDAEGARAALAGAPAGMSAVSAAAFRPDGAWRHGLLIGRAALPEGAAEPRYFGAENRRRRHDADLSRLRQERRALDHALAAAEAGLAEAEARTERAAREFDLLPRLTAVPALQRAAVLAAEAVVRAEAAQRAEERELARLESARAALAAARQALEEAQAQVPETRGRGAEGVEALSAHLRAAVTACREVAAGTRAVEDAAAALQDALEGVVRERADLEAAGADLEAEQGERARAAGAVQALRAVVESPEGQEQRARFRQLFADEVRLRAETQQAGESVVRWSERVDRTAEDEARARVLVEACAAPEGQARSALEAQLGASPRLALQLEGLRSGPSGAEDVSRALLQRRRDDAHKAERIAADLEAARGELVQVEVACRDTLAEYVPEMDAASGLVRFRAAGPSLWPVQLHEELQLQLRLQEQLLQASERQLYEEFLLHQMREALHRRIRDTEDWTENINTDLREARLGSGEVLELRWVPVPGAGIAAHLNLLRTDPAMLQPEDRQALSDAFRTEVERVRREQREEAGDLSFGEALEEAMDYRRWFRFEIVSRSPHQRAVAIDERRFSTRSGAEKSLALMLPLAAAAAARYRLARPDAPRLIAFDEAFAGVDPRNVEETLRFLCRFGFSWVMASERLWGVGSVLPAAATYELMRLGNVVGVLPFFWDGERMISAGAEFAPPQGEGAP